MKTVGEASQIGCKIRTRPKRGAGLIQSVKVIIIVTGLTRFVSPMIDSKVNPSSPRRNGVFGACREITY